VEVTRRCPGDLYSLLIEYSTGYQYAGMYCSPFLGRRVEPVGFPKDRFIVRHTVTATEETRFHSLAFNRAVCLAGYFSLARSGEMLARAPAGRAGILFAETTSYVEQQIIFDELIRRTLYEIR
jgi:hypothetical protein